MKINPTEVKTKVAAFVAFVLSGAALAWLSQESPLFVGALPDWAEVPAGAVVASLTVWLAAYHARHKPDRMSQSAVEAFRDRLGKRAGYNAPRESV